jgi:CheY-like chemotaxis protein/DNA-directed RNA polymerase specialized sigma24 family protein
MSLVDKIGPHLPYLRRYARALTGSQESGDAYVRAALAALAGGEREIDPHLSSQAALYQLFHAIWGTPGPALDPDPGTGPGKDASARLLKIAPINRQALLLTAMEGFSHADAAQIMRCDVQELDAMITDAQREIEIELATDVLIIEDEPVIAADIEGIVRSLGHGVTAVARTRREAVNAVRAKSPGLVLADIQLADGSSGIDAVKDILGIADTPVIFITAFPERLLTGERPEPTYLITKPFLPESVKAAIGQALFFHSRASA